MPLEFTAQSYESMAAVQKKLVEVLNQINRVGRPEAALVVFAMMRLSRELIEKYPPQTQHMLVEQLLVPFLRREPVEHDGIILLH